MAKLAKCSVCGRITDDFVIYGSLFLTDEYPQECPHVCGSDCMVVACDKISSREWQVPVLRMARGGNYHDISKPRKGYDAQPRQDDLVAALIALANAKLSHEEGGKEQL